MGTFGLEKMNENRFLFADFCQEENLLVVGLV